VTLGSEFTLSHWIRFDDHVLDFPGHVAASFSVGAAGTPEPIRSAISHDGRVGGSVTDGSSNGVTSFGPGSNINDSEFHHVAISVSAGLFEHYVDGLLVDSVTISGPVALGTLNAYVGLHVWNGGASRSSRLDGAIDELLLYNRSLSADEIGQFRPQQAY
tara:strand:- start:34 stop:513 length:480 start_codon:yes stop_codon:yes gene_type:complete